MGAPPTLWSLHGTVEGQGSSKGYRPAKVLVWNEILMFVGTQGGPVPPQGCPYRLGTSVVTLRMSFATCLLCV